MGTLAVPSNFRAEEAQNWFSVLGVRFAAVQIPDVIKRIEEWIEERRQTHYVCVSNVHSVVECQRDAQLKETLNTSDLNVPDGMPIVWLGRSKGHNLPRRVYGPDLFQEFCCETQDKPYRHFLYGGTPEVVETLVGNLKQQFPRLQMAGHFSPPFRSLTEEEDRSVIEMINGAAPDVLWVGLGCPKQEVWMRSHRQSLAVPAIIGVGQAFNIYAGSVRQAPRWMREHGLEWLFRLQQEPRRLWQRYLVYNTEFLIRLTLEALGIVAFDSTPFES
jgi:N-acetylglucosaminyldiphosphoundecaprenol N-acetyl-beta-D-mannosaminyltransferase